MRVYRLVFRFVFVGVRVVVVVVVMVRVGVFVVTTGIGRQGKTSFCNLHNTLLVSERPQQNVQERLRSQPQRKHRLRLLKHLHLLHGGGEGMEFSLWWQQRLNTHVRSAYLSHEVGDDEKGRHHLQRLHGGFFRYGRIAWVAPSHEQHHQQQCCLQNISAKSCFPDYFDHSFAVFSPHVSHYL